MIRLFHWDAARQYGSFVDPASVQALKRSPECEDVWWIDLERPTEEEESRVFEQWLPLHPLTIDDMTRPRRMADGAPHLPKVEEFPDYLFVIVNPLRKSTRERLSDPDKCLEDTFHLTSQLSAVVSSQVLLTHHYRSPNTIAQLERYLEKHPDHAARGPDYLFHLVLDVMVDDYAPMLDGVVEALDEIELQVFRAHTPQALEQLLRLKRDVLKIRKTLVLEREVLARLSRGEFRLIDQRETAYYRNVYDHLMRYTELIENSRDMISDLLQTHLAATSNRLNEIMKVLTMISVTILPMSLISGIYGMNFDEIPELHWAMGYPMALGLMLLAGLSSLAFFRWRGWL